MHPRSALWPALALLPFLAAAALVEARSTSASLESRIQARIKKAGIKSGRYGIVVMTRGPGPKVEYVHGSTRALLPASVAKVVTTAIVLDVLGPGHVFRTRISARGKLSDTGVLDGDLVLHGSGDPGISGRMYDGNVQHVPEKLAKAVFDAGIRRVNGALVLDDGLFDREYVHADWSEEDKRHWYGAPVGALSFNDNCVDVSVNQRGVISTGGPWRVRNDVKAVANARTAVGGRWLEGGKVLQLHGRLAPGKLAKLTVPVREPAPFLARSVRFQLRQQGIRVNRGVRLARDAADRKAGRIVAEHEAELPPALAVMNQRSQNFYSSMLFKTAGAAVKGRGTWESGNAAYRIMLERRRIADKSGTVMRDGSGLSLKNRLSAGVLVQILQAFDQDVLRGPLFYESLAVSGVSGTLRKRLRDANLKGRVHAKTGTLNDKRARGLAGYIDGAKGKPGKVFAILLNGPGASHAVIDDILREIVK